MHILAWFVIDFTDSTVFHSIEYFILILFKFDRWIASLLQFLGFDFRRFRERGLMFIISTF